MLRKSIFQHLGGIVGQTAAAVPLLTVTVILSRTTGLETAGKFTVVVGVSAAAFVAAVWGFRTAILLDQFKTFPAVIYAEARIVAMFAASVVAFSAAIGLGLSWILSITIIVYRLSDAIIDLNFAILQVSSGTSVAIRYYLLNHSAKLGLLVVTVVMGLVINSQTLILPVVGAGVISLLGTSWMLLTTLRQGQHPLFWANPARIVKLFKNAWWFAMAGMSCALVTNAPRFSLPWIYKGEILGVVGVALSVSTFYGMVFYTTWIRYLPQLSNTTQPLSVAMRFLLETLVLGVLLAAVSWWMFPQVVNFVFGFPQSDFVLMTREVLTASVVFFGGMNLVNLFKVTPIPWMESVTYLTTLVLTLGVSTIAPQLRTTPTLLCIAGVMMLVIGACPLLILEYRAKEQPAK